MHKFLALQCMNNKLLLSSHHLLWCIFIHCGGRHSVSVMVNTVLLKIKYTSCYCCSTLSLRNMLPATTHLKYIHRPCQPYSLSACHLSMQHHHGLTRIVLCLLKKLVARIAIAYILYIHCMHHHDSCSSSLPENI